MTVIAFTPHLAPIATALADEGVPVRVISRSMHVPAEDMRGHLHDAVKRGELIEMPQEDWPPTARRRDRVPLPTQAEMENLTISVRTVFKLTAQEATVFCALLTRNEAKKEQLLAAVQHQRMNKPALPQDLEEPQLKLIDVVICKVRKKVKVHGVEIKTVWGAGYSISKEHRDLAFRLISEYIAGQTRTESTDAQSNVLDFKQAA